MSIILQEWISLPQNKIDLIQNKSMIITILIGITLPLVQINLEIPIIMMITMYRLNKGIKEFGELGTDAVKKEMLQLNKRGVF
jgi:hypothetical protein